MLPFAMSPILKMIVASLAGGIGVAVVFSLAVLGITRSTELRRDRRSGPAAAYGTLGLIGLVLSAALVVLGVVLVAHKS
jgi:uncharacterized membrane protein